jgi:hypothetical protein
MPLTLMAGMAENTFSDNTMDLHYWLQPIKDMKIQ